MKQILLPLLLIGCVTLALSASVNPLPHHGPKHGVSVSREQLVQYDEQPTRGAPSQRASKRVGQEYGPPPSSYYPHPPQHDPEPIIEIIIKDSNESLPAPPPVYNPAPKPTKEPVQVFYVKYKKNPNSKYGKEDEVIYEPPVPALTPPTNNKDLETPTPYTYTEAYTTPLPPRPSTTLRTIIRPDSEIYHGTGGVKVTFGKTEIHHAPVLTHREDSPRDHVTKRDSQAAGSELQPVRRNPEYNRSPVEYRSPILNHNEFQALPPDYNKGNKEFNPGPYQNEFKGPANNGDFSGPFKNGPNSFQNGPKDYLGPNGLVRTVPNSPFDGKFEAAPNGPLRNGPLEGPHRGQHFNAPARPPFESGPVRPNFDTGVRNGPPFGNEGPIRNGGGPNFDAPHRNAPHFEGAPVRNAPVHQNFNRNPENFNRPDSYFPQNSGNPGNIRQLPNVGPKVSFPGAPQQLQRPAEIQNQGPVYSKPHQPLQVQYQQTVRPQKKPFQPSQPIYSPQELFQPPTQLGNTPQFGNNAQFGNTAFGSNGFNGQQISGFSQAALKTPPMQTFNTQDAVTKPASNYEQAFKKPAFDDQYNQQYSSQGNKPPTYEKYQPTTLKQSTEIASFDETVYQKPSSSISQDQKYAAQKQQDLQKQQQLYELNKQQAQLYFAKQQAEATASLQQTNLSPSNVEAQNNLFVSSDQTLSSLKEGTELSNEEYQLLLEKQRLAQVKLQQKDRDQGYQQLTVGEQKEQQRLQNHRPETPSAPSESQQYQNSPQYQQTSQYQSSSPQQQQSSQYQPTSQTSQYQSNSQYQQSPTKLSQYQTSGKKPVELFSKPTTKYVSTTQPSVKYTASGDTQVTTEATETSTELTKEQKERYNKNLLALPDEVPDDIRQQLLSAGILGNADIQILDYDKVGDIPIENLPPEALANFYGSGGAKQKRSSEITKRSADIGSLSAESEASPAEGRSLEMKVVKFNPDTVEGQQIAQSYLQGQTGQTSEVTLDPVILNDSSYNRYLPLKVNGASFPLPSTDLLRNRRITSVVVLAPVDYDSIVPDDPTTSTDQRDGKAVKVAGVRFVSGNALNELIKSPTEGNFKHWLSTEKQYPVSRQSIVLLVTSPTTTNDATDKQVFMYDFNSDNISHLQGDLSQTFLEVAESNASSEELDYVSQDTANVPTVQGGSQNSPVQGGQKAADTPAQGSHRVPTDDDIHESTSASSVTAQDEQIFRRTTPVVRTSQGSSSRPQEKDLTKREEATEGSGNQSKGVIKRQS